MPSLKKNAKIVIIGKFYNELDASNFSTKGLELIEEKLKEVEIIPDGYILLDTIKALDILSLLNPKIIVLLGATAHYLFSQEKWLEEMKNQFKDYKNAKMITNFHPSYILEYADDSQKEEFNELFKILKKEIASYE